MEIEKRPVEERTLYICINNVGRSQMAEAYHNKKVPGSADSAGLRVDEPGGRVADWVGGAEIICQAMDEVDLSIANNTRTQYHEELAEEYGSIVYMLSLEQMQEMSLDQILDDTDVEFRKRNWLVADPRDMTIEDVITIRDDIFKNVGLLAVNHAAELTPVLV